MSHAEQNPINFDAYGKGDVITEKKLIAATRAQPDEPEFAIRALGICEGFRERGKVARYFNQERCIKVLTDAEAADWNTALHKRDLKRLQRREETDAMIGRDGMTPEQAEKQDRMQMARALINQAIRRTVKTTQRLMSGRGERLAENEKPERERGAA